MERSTTGSFSKKLRLLLSILHYFFQLNYTHRHIKCPADHLQEVNLFSTNSFDPTWSRILFARDARFCVNSFSLVRARALNSLFLSLFLSLSLFCPIENSNLVSHKRPCSPRLACFSIYVGLRKRPGTGSGSNIAARGAAPNSSILKFYTDGSPGLKITPVVVLVMSVCFIGFVTILHAMSKIYQYKMG